MTYIDVIETIKKIALREPNVNSFVREFDDLNRENTVYSSIILQDDVHSRNNDFMQYSFYIGYADRLTANEGNRDEVIGTGINVINNIINKIDERVDIVSGSIVPFNQRFTAQCAGVYVKITVTVAISDCGIDYNRRGAFNVDYDGDFDN